jgi:hypothetical protein
VRLAFLRGGISALALAVPAAVGAAFVLVPGELLLALILIGLGAALASLSESAALRRPASDELHLWAARFAWAACSGWVWLAFLQTAFASSLWRSGQLRPEESLPNLLELLRSLRVGHLTCLLLVGLALGLPFGATVRGRLEERRGTRVEATRLTHRFLVQGLALLSVPFVALTVVDPILAMVGVAVMVAAYPVGVLGVILLQTVFERAARYERGLRKPKA